MGDVYGVWIISQKAAFFEKWTINGNEPDIPFHIFILKEFILKELSFGT